MYSITIWFDSGAINSILYTIFIIVYQRKLEFNHFINVTVTSYFSLSNVTVTSYLKIATYPRK